MPYSSSKQKIKKRPPCSLNPIVATSSVRFFTWAAAIFTSNEQKKILSQKKHMRAVLQIVLSFTTGRATE